MSTLYDFYKTELQPVLIEEEQQRQSVINETKILSVLVFLLAAGWVVFLVGGIALDGGLKDLSKAEINDLLMLAAMAAFQTFIPTFGIWFFLRRSLLRLHKRRTKQATISKVIQYVDPGLEYNAQSSISLSAIRHSGLFKNNNVSIYREDMIFGKIKGLDFTCSDLHIGPKVFKGLFAEVDLAEQVKPVICIFPKNIVNNLKDKLTILDTAGSELTGRRELERIKLEDPEFDRHFIVYASDQIESRMILTTKLINDISSFREEKKQGIMLSIKSDKLYIAVPSSQDLFEPNVFKSYLSPEHVRESLKELNIVVELVKDVSIIFESKIT